MEEVRKLFDLLQVHNWLFFYFLFTRLFSRGSGKSMNVKKKRSRGHSKSNVTFHVRVGRHLIADFFT